MKRYSTKFALEDKMRESTASKEQVERRRAQMADYQEWCNKLAERHRADKEKRLQLRRGNVSYCCY